MTSVLVVGSGGSGRQHALGWKMARSPLVDKVYFAPGNGGTAFEGQNVPIEAEDFDGLVKFAHEKHIDLTVVGPEAPLIAGIVDRFQAEGLPIFGPDKTAAQLEGSKVYAADFMERHAIPRPDSVTVSSLPEAQAYLNAHDPLLYVIKTDGLSGGKGVIVPQSQREAEVAITEIMDEKVFGESGNKVVFQERLHGQEVSAFALSDGERIVMLPCFQDYKQAYNGDKGPNTGGIGAYGPPPFLSEDLQEKIKIEILQKTIDGMRADGRPFRGILYPGLFITEAGEPKVIEYNCRFGDPETQTMMPLLDEDLYPLLLRCSQGKLRANKVKTKTGATASVVLCSHGYPGKYETNKSIKGLDAVHDPDIVVHHGCTSVAEQGLVSSGGRVMTVTARGTTITAALEKVYSAIGPQGIHFENMHYRTDIGFRLATSGN
jgi:phosphoribosylamine--glycine ligase